MQRHDLLDLAVANNVHWYASMCTAHEISFVSRKQYWLAREAMPPFHSNFVSASGSEDRYVQRDALESLRAEMGDGSWSVKDSYNALGLSERGFTLLFRAQWLCLDGPAVCPSYCTEEINWTAAQTPRELAEWSALWEIGNEEASGSAQFPAALLDTEDIRFMTGRMEGEPIAVAAANRSGRAVGVSNVAAQPGTGTIHWYSCIRSIQHIFPGLVVVGHAQGAELSAMRDVGFRSLGGLSVWTASEK